MKTPGEKAYDAYHDALSRRVVGHVKQPWIELGSAWQAAWEEVGKLGLVPLVTIPATIGELYITSRGRAELAKNKSDA